MDAIDQIVRLLIKILRHPSSREVTVAEFEKYLRKIEVRRSISGNVLDILVELNYDLGFYVADPVMRAQDPAISGTSVWSRKLNRLSNCCRKLGLSYPVRCGFGSRR